MTAPVNDFAHVIDAQSAAGIERLSRSLKAASGDVVVVATVPTIEPYGDIREYTTKLFQNGGRGIGEKGKNNGVLILLALKQRKVWIEVGYGLEEWITDRFSGETSRQYMVPEFRTGAYGTGLLVGTARVVGRIAKGKNLKLDVQVPQDDEPEGRSSSFPLWLPIVIFIAILVISRIGGGPGAGLLLWGLSTLEPMVERRGTVWRRTRRRFRRWRIRWRLWRVRRRRQWRWRRWCRLVD